jgi:hypothetical protein
MTTDTVTAKSSVEEISRATFNPQKICRVYVQKWKTYKAWVDSTDGISPTQNRKYLSRENVNKFFLLQLQYKDHIQPKNLEQFKIHWRHTPEMLSILRPCLLSLWTRQVYSRRLRASGAATRTSGCKKYIAPMTICRVTHFVMMIKQHLSYLAVKCLRGAITACPKHA